VERALSEWVTWYNDERLYSATCQRSSTSSSTGADQEQATQSA